jgi:GABA(A) receptor-associated protein
MEELKNYSRTLKTIIGDIVDENFPSSFPSAVKTNQEITDYEKRCADSTRLRIKYPNHIPVVINSLDKEIVLKKYKYLVPKELNASQLMISIRSQLVLDSYKALFIFVDNTLLDNLKTIGEIYENYLIKNKIKSNGDKHFYITLMSENTFGNII